MPGSGKTTLGPKLANRLQRPFYDLDAFIETEEGRSVAALFAQFGEACFREKEAAALRKLANQVDKALIAAGGGTPCFNGNMRFMNQTGVTVFLDTPVADLTDRLWQQGLKNRPLLAGKNKAELNMYLSETLRNRSDFYQQARVITRPEKLATAFLEKILNALRSDA